MILNESYQNSSSIRNESCTNVEVIFRGMEGQLARQISVCKLL